MSKCSVCEHIISNPEQIENLSKLADYPKLELLRFVFKKIIKIFIQTMRLRSSSVFLLNFILIVQYYICSRVKRS